MDEPFAALDALTRRRMQEELWPCGDEVRFTLLFVTHSIEEALVVGNRVALLSPHPGRVSSEINSHALRPDEPRESRLPGCRPAPARAPVRGRRERRMTALARLNGRCPLSARRLTGAAALRGGARHPCPAPRGRGSGSRAGCARR